MITSLLATFNVISVYLLLAGGLVGAGCLFFVARAFTNLVFFPPDKRDYKREEWNSYFVND